MHNYDRHLVQKVGIGIIFFVLLYFPYLIYLGRIETYAMAESKKELNNPKRGFYVQLSTEEAYKMPEYREEGFRVVLLTLNLNGYQNNPKLNRETLSELRTALLLAKEQNIGIVFRAAYHFFGDEYEEPEDIGVIKSHVEQIAPVLNEAKDILMGVQAGFLGPYGEWHNSIYMENASDGEPYRIHLLRKMTEVLDDDIVINLRRPMFIREAVSYGMDIKQFGYHDDALLSTDTDMGTYVEEGFDREAELDWVNSQITTPVNGGEMTNVSEYTVMENAVLEFHKLSLTYLNLYYNTDVILSWKDQIYQGQNGYEYMRDHLGYRLHIQEVNLPKQISANFNQKLARQLQRFTKPDVILQLKNTGFAKPMDSYQTYLVLQSGEDRLILPTQMEYKEKDTLEITATIAELDSFMQDGREEILVGLLMTSSMEKEQLEWNKSDAILFANDEGIVTDGIHIIARYVKKNATQYELIQEI